MHLHGNAKTTPRSRREIVSRVSREKKPVQQVARAFGISGTTVRKWLRRWREEGPRGLLDRSSAPHHIPHRTPVAIERRIEKMRRRRWVAQRIARAVQLAVSTVSAVLQRLGLGRLAALEPPAAPPQRYEREHPGDLVHIDVKKLGRVRGIGHRIHGQRRVRARGVGWEFVHVCVDDHTRLAYAEVLEDERKETCVGFLERALTWLAGLGIRTQEVMTDNGSAYNSLLWKKACQNQHLRHLKTRPYTPRTNGKAERFIQTLIREWAYKKPYRSSAGRKNALRPWLRRYNTQRPHRGLGDRTPFQRLAQA